MYLPNSLALLYREILSHTIRIFGSTVNNGHTRDWSKWPLCTGDRYRQVGYNMGSLVGTY